MNLLQPSFTCLLSTGIKGKHHHAQLAVNNNNYNWVVAVVVIVILRQGLTGGVLASLGGTRYVSQAILELLRDSPAFASLVLD